MPMPKHEAHAIEIAERVSSVFSVLGAFFIITTFVFNYRFRKPINRLVFYASWGNLFANVATLISRSGIKLGVDAPLCQFQAFLIQWFMPADALWTFAMALNVFLTFFRQHDAASLRKLEWKYLVLCYGIPFIPALAFCFIDTAERGKFYGSANLWCWVSTKWKIFRMATFYGPIWIVITTNVIIYIKVGAVVLKWRHQLMSLKRSPSSALAHAQPSPAITVPMRDMGSPGPTAALTKSYEVSIVSQVPHYPPNRSRHLSAQSPTTPTPTHHRFPSNQSTTIQEQAHIQRRTTIVHPVSIVGTHRIVDVNRATVSYCYTALLFFLVLLVTWVPSTVNRLYTLIKPNSASPFALDFASGLVLPLQGFWNMIIYVVTSLPACKALFTDFRDRFRSDSTSTAFQDPSRPPPGIRRHVAQLGSDDTTNRFSEAVDPKWGHESKSSHTLTEAMRSPRKSESRDFTGGVKNRADIVISFDGKKRVVHDRRESGPGNPFENPKQDFEKPRTRAGEEDWEGERGEEWVPPRKFEEGGGQTRLYESVGGSQVSLGGDDEGGSTTSDEIEMKKGRERMSVGDFRVGMAR